MKVKTAELSLDRLDYFTALAIGEKSPQIALGGGCVVSHGHTLHRFYPSSEWQHGGRLIDEHKLNLSYTPSGLRPEKPWFCCDNTETFWSIGETPLIAICRAVVASKLGDEVDIPDELMES